MPKSKLSFSLCPLDPHFVGPKPIEFAPDSTLEEVESRGDLIIQRKRNGYGAYVTATGSRRREIGFYTRGVENITAKFPALREEMRSINIPNGTLLVSEMLVEVAGADLPGAFTSVVKSNPDRAILLQESQPAKLALFNVLVHKGKSVAHLPYRDRLDIVREILAKHQGPQIGLVEVLHMPLKDAKELSRTRKWEGLVLYDGRAGTGYCIGQRAKTPRPLGCWKWKEYNESDFVATGFVPSTARSHVGAVKDFLIAQYNPETLELEDWGKCGIGISEAERRELADPKLYPLVFEIKFERRTKNRRLILAQIMRRRLDKKPEECFSPIDWAEHL